MAQQGGETKRDKEVWNYFACPHERGERLLNFNLGQNDFDLDYNLIHTKQSIDSMCQSIDQTIISEREGQSFNRRTVDLVIDQ